MERKTVLIADDDPVFVAAISAVLQTRYAVKTASNGTEALEEIAKEFPDLVILDVMMDYMSEGFDVARKLRTNPATRSIPLIMLTGVDQLYNYRLEQDESWVPSDRYLEKPIEPETLLSEVESLIGSPHP
jgi:CheY-like chemotaxis protein